MFVVYIKGVRNDWGGKAVITHYTSLDQQSPIRNPSYPTFMSPGSALSMPKVAENRLYPSRVLIQFMLPIEVSRPV